MKSPSDFSAAANSARAMFIAALEIAYWMLVHALVAAMKLGSAADVEIAMIFLVDPARMRGRKALVELMMPTTFVLN